MEVVILCGGLGSRLKKETEFIPKPMIHVGGKPLLWHIMKIYSHYGFNDFVLPLGYKGEIIKNYFLDFNSINNNLSIKLNKYKPVINYLDEYLENWNITLVDTGLSSLKGSRIKQIQKYITGKTFMITYGDGVSAVDIQKLLAYHNKHGKIGTVTGVYPPSRFGDLKIKDEQVIALNEKPQVSRGLINGGFFVFDYDIFDYLSVDEKCDFEMGPLEKLISNGELMVYDYSGEWIGADTAREIQYLNDLWNSDSAFWKIW